MFAQQIIFQEFFMERRVDELGRVVIPNHIRKALELEPKTKVKFEVMGKSVVVSKAYPTCIICGCEKDLTEVKDKYVCADCRKQLI